MRAEFVVRKPPRPEVLVVDERVDERVGVEPTLAAQLRLPLEERRNETRFGRDHERRVRIEHRAQQGGSRAPTPDNEREAGTRHWSEPFVTDADSTAGAGSTRRPRRPDQPSAIALAVSRMCGHPVRGRRTAIGNRLDDADLHTYAHRRGALSALAQDEHEVPERVVTPPRRADRCTLGSARARLARPAGLQVADPFPGPVRDRALDENEIAAVTHAQPEVEVVEAEEEALVEHPDFPQRSDADERELAAGDVVDRHRARELVVAQPDHTTTAAVEAPADLADHGQLGMLGVLRHREREDALEQVVAARWIVVVEQDDPVVVARDLEDPAQPVADPARRAEVVRHRQVLTRRRGVVARRQLVREDGSRGRRRRHLGHGRAVVDDDQMIEPFRLTPRARRDVPSTPPDGET